MYHGMLVGNMVQIVTSPDRSLIGKNGIVVEETKNTIALLDVNEKCIRIPKSVVTLNIRTATLQNEKLIEGLQIIGTLSDRIKN